ncbi:MAG TPA: GNAT family N-acetyltransferase [Candidatus Binatia bacterium]|nr:GNAT family N-acetyltransferase [Candidatus Binatia bacterium]
MSTATDRAALLRLVDANTWEMYREICRLARGSILVETAGLTLVRRPHALPWHNMVIVRDVIDADTLLAAVHRLHGDGERCFSVWTRAHVPTDVGLAAALRARGFADLSLMPNMVLHADPGTPCRPAGLEVRAVVDEAGRRDFARVTSAAYGPDFQVPAPLVEDTFVSPLSLTAAHVQGFVGYVERTPVAAAGVWLAHGVAGINFVGTVPEHRGHRYAEAVTWAAVREGFRRGAAFASLQPTHLGRPVYERMGFVEVTQYPLLVESA